MSRPANPVEKRQFGRRKRCLYAWISVPGRPRLSCTVLDISIGGALIGLEKPSWLPYNFVLTIEATRFQSWCEVRHQRADAVGVRFLSATEAASLDSHASKEGRTMCDKDVWSSSHR